MVQPKTRRLIVYSLGGIALSAIGAETAIVLLGYDSSEALLAIVSGATGGLAGALIPTSIDD